MTNLLTGTNGILFLIGVLCFVVGAWFLGFSWGKGSEGGEPMTCYLLTVVGSVFCLIASALIASPLLA